ncbi:hypothetical protein [Flavobacterium sp. LM5]|uniref:hypothetical protein n=1 Tax=Flavobacterium sp. LM5 TaxID=1938610 RepID=UPI00350F28DF
MSKKTILFFCFFFLLAKGWTQETTASAQVSTFSIVSPELQTTKKIWLYLPKNYSTSKKKYSVIYMPMLKIYLMPKQPTVANGILMKN